MFKAILSYKASLRSIWAETCVIAPSLAGKANNTKEPWLDCYPSSPTHNRSPGVTSNSSSCFQGFGLLNKGSLIYAFKFAV